MRLCRECGIELPATIRPNRLWCSEKCKQIYENQIRADRRPKYRAPRPASYSGLCCGTKGAIGELRVATDLLDKGYEVFRSVSPSAPCDLITLKDGEMLRIEVRTAHSYSSTGKITFPKKASDAGKQDHYAAVLPDQIVYMPSLA